MEDTTVQNGPFSYQNNKNVQNRTSFIQIMQSEVLFNVLFLNYKFISWPISDNKVNNPLKEHFSTLNLFIRSDLTPKMVDFEIKSPNFETNGKF